MFEQVLYLLMNVLSLDQYSEYAGMIDDDCEKNKICDKAAQLNSYFFSLG